MIKTAKPVSSAHSSLQQSVFDETERIQKDHSFGLNGGQTFEPGEVAICNGDEAPDCIIAGFNKAVEGIVPDAFIGSEWNTERIYRTGAERMQSFEDRNREGGVVLRHGVEEDGCGEQAAEGGEKEAMEAEEASFGARAQFFLPLDDGGAKSVLAASTR